MFTSIASHRVRSAGLPCLLLSLVFLLAACSPQPAPRTADESSAEAGAQAAEPAAAEAATEGEEGAAQDAISRAEAEAALRTSGADPSDAPPLPPRLMETAQGSGIITNEELRQQLEPPDGNWLVDDEGRRYFVTSIPRLEGYYRLQDDGKLRIRHGVVYDLVRIGDDEFDVKIYAPVAPNIPVAYEPPPPVETVVPETVDRLRLERFDRGLPEKGQWRNGFALADMNGDGHLDIVHGPSRKGLPRPNVFLGDGQGNWRPWDEARFPSAGLDYGDAAVADFNRDGHPDIAFASHLRGVLVMVNDGQGNFRVWSEGTGFANPAAHQGTADFSSRAIEVVDWDGDGLTDVIALGEGPRMTGMRGPDSSGGLDVGSQGLMVFLNQGDGTWTTRNEGLGRGQIFGDSLSLADLDGDGRLDVVTSSGAFGRTDLLALVDEKGGWKPATLEGAPSNAYIWAVDTADFNGDGRADVAVGYQRRGAGSLWHSGIDVLQQGADGTWEQRTLISIEDESGIWSLAAGDLDADGNTDLVGVSGLGEPVVLLGDGTGAFVREDSEEEMDIEICRGYHVELEDLDGRPGDEIVVGFAGESGSEVMIAGLARRCPDGGRLAAWRVTN